MLKRISCILCAALLMLSMTGCFFLRRSTASTSFDYEELRKTVTEDLTNEISVTDWNGNVPDGMEVKYVVVKEVYRNDRSRDTELYDYDKAGRVIYYKSDSSAYTDEWKLAYNDDGTIARREYRSLKARGSAPACPDYTAEYEYNDKKQLVSFSYTTNGHLTYKFEYENGHLVHTDLYGGKDYTYSTESEYYDYCVVVSDDINTSNEQDDIRICKRTYADDTFEKVLTEQYEYDEWVTQFEYNGSELTGSYYIDQWGRTHKFDANGNLSAELDKDGSVLEKWEYNENGDRVLYERYDNGVLVDKTTTSVLYDGAGNKQTETSDFWYVMDGEEKTFTAKTTYSYRNGLLVSELDEIDGDFSSLKVYAYKAILVPKE